jgi:hypothetical protein
MSGDETVNTRHKLEIEDIKGVNAPKVLVTVEMLRLDKKGEGMGIKSRKPGSFATIAYEDWESFSNIDAIKNEDGNKLEFTAEVPIFSEICAFPSRTGVISDWKNKKFSDDMHSTEQAIFVVYVFKGGKSALKDDFSDVFYYDSLAHDEVFWGKRLADKELDEYKDFDNFLSRWACRQPLSACSEILVSLDEGGNIESYYIDQQKVTPGQNKSGDE